MIWTQPQLIAGLDAVELVEGVVAVLLRPTGRR